MNNEIEIVIPVWMSWANENDTSLDSLIRAVSIKYSQDPDLDWAGKYGTHYNDEKVRITPFCWCEKNDCPYCAWYEWTDNIPENVLSETWFDTEKISSPNFWYKPLDYKVWWYKYIWRGVNTNKDLSEEEYSLMKKDLLWEI